MTGVYLTLNAGSSSLKFAVFPGENESTTPELRGKIAGIGRAPAFSVSAGDAAIPDPGALARLDPASGHDQVIALLLPWLASYLAGRSVLAVGHRCPLDGRTFRSRSQCNWEQSAPTGLSSTMRERTLGARTGQWQLSTAYATVLVFRPT